MGAEEARRPLEWDFCPRMPKDQRSRLGQGRIVSLGTWQTALRLLVQSQRSAGADRLQDESLQLLQRPGPLRQRHEGFVELHPSWSPLLAVQAVVGPATRGLRLR